MRHSIVDHNIYSQLESYILLGMVGVYLFQLLSYICDPPTYLGSSNTSLVWFLYFGAKRLERSDYLTILLMAR